ncbi:N-acetylglucosaminyltransferase, partial [Bifidobacterium animalis]|nr:N-acetylglucosaminyltransferase [Bifidobacterium animalis]
FICPFTVLANIRVLLGTIFAACGFISWSSQGAAFFNWILGAVSSMVLMMVLAGPTLVEERKQIGASKRE